MNRHEVDRGDSFKTAKTRTQTLQHAETSKVKYDLIGKIAGEVKLTRRTVAKILSGLRADKILMFKYNPEEFISKVVKYINEQKATMIVDHISYDETSGTYDSAIFTAEKSSQSFDKAFRANKAIQDYVFTDGSAEQSIERRFAEDLDAAEEVCVYAKLPKGFHIPTPVGNYSPDWAIAFNEGTVKHIYFIAETKGTMDSGKELTQIVHETPFQWIWAVLSGFQKDITLEEVLAYPCPEADGYPGFWHNPLSMQNPLATIEIVPWDSSLVLFFSRKKKLVDKFRAGYPYSEDLFIYNSEF